MSGLVKQKQYDWKDSNLALFGSDTEKQVKKESAETEPAWKNAGKAPGIQIWRIEKFKVKDWPTNQYGQFFNGDSYIILNTYKENDSEALLYDVHFWIGKYSTQDEYGTAAYKTVELDTLLDDVPIQHREVQEFESELFRSYFKEITYLNGGAESGFRHVKPEEYVPRLFHFHGQKMNIIVKEVRRHASKLDDSDVFILDAGNKIYQWNGKTCNAGEKTKAMQYVQKLKSERSGKAITTIVIDQASGGSEQAEFMKLLDGEDNDDDSDSPAEQTSANKTKQLFRLSDADGEMKFALEKSDTISLDDFDTKDVFIFDSKTELFVWIGKLTTQAEKQNAMTYAHKYLSNTDHPFVSVSCLKEGSPSKAFTSALAA